MDNITLKHMGHHEKRFREYGRTSKGVDWGDEGEFWFRHEKMLSVVKKDFLNLKSTPSLLDVGCGWGALFALAKDMGVDLEYTGIDVVDVMVKDASEQFPGARFVCCDVFDWSDDKAFDFVVCNGVMTQKHSDTAIPEMEGYCRRLIKKMFSISRYGIAFNMMSTRVNYMANNLYYQNPVELFSWLLCEVSPRVVFDHGYSSLGRGRGKLYDFTVYVYKG